MVFLGQKPNLWASHYVHGWGSVPGMAAFQNPMDVGRTVHQRKDGKVRAGCYAQKEDERDVVQSNKTQVNMYLLCKWKTIVFLRLHKFSQNLSVNFRILARIIDSEFETMEKAIWINLLISVGN